MIETDSVVGSSPEGPGKEGGREVERETKKSLEVHQTLSRILGGVWARDYKPIYYRAPSFDD